MSKIEIIDKSTGSYVLRILTFCSSVGFISVLKLFSNLPISFYLFFILTKSIQPTGEYLKDSCRYSGINNYLTIIVFCINAFKLKVLVISVITFISWSTI